MIRKTLERSDRGVVLIRVEDLSAPDRPLALGYRLSTPRLTADFRDRNEAYAAFLHAARSSDVIPTPLKRAGSRR